MVIPFIDQKIRRAFSNAAGQYDILTSMHKEIARELTNKVIRASAKGCVLDVGMGTGWMTNRLHTFLPDAKIIGLDFADGMIKEAKEKYDHLTMIQANACSLPFKREVFDVVVSNFAYQWMQELDESFGQCRAVLKKDGRILMTVFGYETFNELFTALQKVASGQKMEFNRLSKQEDILKALQKAQFKNIKIEAEPLKVRFQDMFDLLKWVKNIGANCLGNNMHLGNELLRKANLYYVNNYQDRLGAYATLEVIWVEAQI